MKAWVRNLLFLLGGAGAGLAYYHFFGCAGSCPITSNPWLTAGYFSLIGILLSLAFGKNPKS